MGRAPLVTVVFTSYNHGRFVEESIDSVLAQSAGDLEVIVIDDGSSDDSYERLQSIADTRVTVHRNDRNRGRHSRNWAIQNSRGALVAFQNSDDRWHPDKLAAQVQFLADHPDCGLCFTAVDLCDDDGVPCPEHPVYGAIFPVEEHDRFGWLRRFFLSGNCLAHPSALIRRDVLRRTGLFDPGLFQLPDFDLWVRAAGVTELAVLPAPLTTVRVHPDGSNVSAPSPAAINRTGRELEEIARRYGVPPILDDVARIFDLEPDGEPAPAANRDIRQLASLGRFATSLDEAHQLSAGIHFLREALRRADERNALDQDARGRLVQALHRACGEPGITITGDRRRQARFRDLVKAAIYTITLNWM